MQELTRLALKPGKEQSLFRRHPWIFSGALKQINKGLTEGQLVEITGSSGQFLAIGHYQIGSIAVRIISFEKTEINYHFWKSKIEAAIRLRKELKLLDNNETNVFRLVNAEGDELPGLIIDFYNGTAVTQFHSIGMYLAKDEITKALVELLGSKLTAVYDKSEGTMPFKAAVKPKNGILWGESLSDEVLEYGNKFKVDWTEGQKTGFFIDQRENRKLVQQYSKGKRVLNVFGYTGGFSIYALQGNAALVHSVDSSKPAIDLTNQNVLLNLLDTNKQEAFATDAFKFLDDIKDKYDLIILDPPAFAKHNSALNNALQGYRRINQKAIEQIVPGGILFTFSCSQVVTKDDFRKSVFVAASTARRKVSILHQLTQPADHPVSIYHPEGEYLKGLVLFVE